MTRQLECPVCEQRFTIPSNFSEKKVQCPGCSRKFKLRSNKKKPPKPETPKPERALPAAPIPAAPIPAAPIPLAKPITPKEDPAPTTPSPTPTQENEPLISKQMKTSRAISKAAKKNRKKQKMIRGIAGILALAIVVGILSGLLVLRLREANQPTTAADSQPQGPPSSVEPSLDSLTGAPPSTSAPIASTRRPSTARSGFLR